VAAEAARQHKIHLAVQQSFKLLSQGEIVAETTILRQIDQQIDVAVWTLLAPSHRAEQAQVRRTVALGDLVQRVAAEAKVIAKGHGCTLPHPRDVRMDGCGQPGRRNR
jgi:hypothetical protein